MLNTVRMAKYTHTSIGFFLDLPIEEYASWQSIINAEIERENKAIESAGKGGRRG